MKARAIVSCGEGLPMRNVSPFGKPAIPVTWLRPLPPESSGLTYASAFFQSLLPMKNVEVSDVWAGSLVSRLLAPEYFAVKSGWY